MLIGFMGSGKTRAGKILAGKLKRKFVDTDRLIEEREKMSIADIFKTRGEKVFRDIEAHVIQDVSQLRGAVIAVGGGAVLKKENVRSLKKHGVLVWLKVSADTVHSRTADDDFRPLLSVPAGNKKTVIPALLSERAPYYRGACNMEVCTDGRTARQVADEIIKGMSEKNETENYVK